MNQLTLTSKLWNSEDNRFTPDYILKKINAVFRIKHWEHFIDFDPCTTPDNPCSAKHFKTIEDDSINCFDWDKHKRIYLNPPAENPIPFIEKLIDSLLDINSYSEVAIAALQVNDQSENLFNLIQLADVICYPKKRIKWEFSDRNEFCENQFVFALFTKTRITNLNEVDFYDFDVYQRTLKYVDSFCYQFQEIGLISKPCILE